MRLSFVVVGLAPAEFERCKGREKRLHESLRRKVLARETVVHLVERACPAAVRRLKALLLLLLLLLPAGSGASRV